MMIFFVDGDQVIIYSIWLDLLITINIYLLVSLFLLCKNKAMQLSENIFLFVEAVNLSQVLLLLPIFFQKNDIVLIHRYL